MKLNSVLLKSSFVGALGGLLFGFDTAVIAGTTNSLTTYFELNSQQLAVTVSIALIGTVLGAMTAGNPGQRNGGRDTLRVLAIFYIVSSLGCALAWSWPALLAFRFVGGLAIGGSSVLGPVYIAEVAPAKYRGRLVGAFQISIVVGILLAYLSNYFIGTLNLGAMDWRWMFGVAAVPALIFFGLLFGIPNSPRWLATKGRNAE
ncbi:MAG: MFS transporter, partial [Candidatus Acidiferrales bacterium]